LSSSDDRDRWQRCFLDEVWGRAAAAFNIEELGQVVFAVAVINTWNRLQITTRVEPGHYHPGMFDAPASVGNGR
jgi:hypothetical protein